MAGTRKARVPMAEQIRLINECRQSGMTDADWFSASRVNGTNYDFGADLDYFNMTDAKADQISFIGRRYEFFEQAVGLRDFLSQNTYHT